MQVGAKRKVWRSVSFAGWFLVAPLLISTGSFAGSECTRFGKPSYTADRTTQIAGTTIKSKVYVMGDYEREEIIRGKRTEVLITTPKEFASFDVEAKSGIRRSFPIAAAKGDKSKMRLREEDVDGNKRLILEASDESGTWVVLNEVICTTDGIMLSKKAKLPINSKVVESSIVQTVRSVAPLDQSLFAIPKDVQFK